MLLCLWVCMCNHYIVSVVKKISNNNNNNKKNNGKDKKNRKLHEKYHIQFQININILSK